jgi:hypothetical protein
VEHADVTVRTAGGLMLALIIALAGVLAGAWWAPFVVGLAIGIIAPRARIAIPLGAATGLLAWMLPLGASHLRYGIWPTAKSLAAIMGFAGAPIVPVILTWLVGLLLGLCGAWLGSAVRIVLWSAALTAVVPDSTARTGAESRAPQPTKPAVKPRSRRVTTPVGKSRHPSTRKPKA